MTNSHGESYPLGIHVGGWTAAVILSSVADVIIREKMGYHTSQAFGSGTVEQFFAMAGCQTPADIEDRGCAKRKIVHHLSLEGWTDGYAATWNQIQQDYPDTAPQNLGGTGYAGLSSDYITQEVQERALSDSGLSLEFYRSYNRSWHDAGQYFDRISQVDTSLLAPCNQSRLMVSEAMLHYANLTGDWDGVENVSGKVIGKCFQGHFWFAPACRQNASACYMHLTAGSGWGWEHTMQKSAKYLMPTALALAKDWAAYVSLPTQVVCSFYWWQPDPAFLALSPLKILYPAYDAAAWRRNEYFTLVEDISIDKYVSTDLHLLAPRVLELMKGYSVSMSTLNQMMLDQLNTGDEAEQVACRWLKANRAIWEAWLPDDTACFPQFGLYNQRTQEFVDNRDQDVSELTCRACASGTFSSRLRDDKGITYVCEPCIPGTAQPFGASLTCEPCRSGEFQDEHASTTCKRCPVGTYQDQAEQSECKKCPSSTTTYGLKSISKTDCGCEQTFINIAEEDDPVCTPCGPGVICPFSSSMATLSNGTAPLGAAFVPQIAPGHFSTKEAPLSVFKCEDEAHCPGGRPGTCASELLGVPCAECISGQTWINGECVGCGAGTIVLWVFFMVLFFLTLPAVYYAGNQPVVAKVSIRQTIGMSVGLVVALLQTLAIIGLMTVEWPGSFQGSTDWMKAFLLDVDSFSFACIGGTSAPVRYILTVLVFPTGIAWLCLCRACSAWLPNSLAQLRWGNNETLNTMGHFLQVSFGPMSTIALQCLMCYTHPNGAHSLLKYPAVMCGEGEHVTMMVAGLLLLVVFVICFFGLCAWAAWSLPSWSAKQWTGRVQSFTFFLYRFRMDRWWFGLLVLMRIPLISLCVVLATDFPMAQACLTTLILSSYLVLQSWKQPWKAPILNWVDTFCSTVLLQISGVAGLGISLQEGESFAETFTLLLLVALFSGLILMVVALTVAVLQQCSMGQAQQRFLRLLEGSSDGMADRLEELAKELLLQSSVMETNLEKMNPYDLTHLNNCIDLLGVELQSKSICRNVANRVGSSRFQKAPATQTPAVPDPTDPTSQVPQTDSSPEEAPAPPHAPVVRRLASQSLMEAVGVISTAL